jgi:predicted alpha-1,2-mannosidase
MQAGVSVALRSLRSLRLKAFRIDTSNMLRNIVFILLAACCLPLTLAAQARDYTRYVNPFIGTGGHGHTFPGATTPFGMVQLSPDTRLDNWDGSSGYHYSDDVIYGFSHTHLSGTGIPDYCDILFMPTIAPAPFDRSGGERDSNGYGSKFSHANEKAEPGYYSVKLDDENILAEMTATSRVGLHRYTFPENNRAAILMDLTWRDKLLDSEFKVVNNNRIEGYRRSSSWAKDQVVYFAAEVSKPFYYSFHNSIAGKGADGKDLSQKVQLHFKTTAGEQIMLKVALSTVSVEGARKNLEAELPGWDFEKTRADAKAAWNKELSKIEVSGGTDAQMTNFYTALYHTAIQPNLFQDVDGNYRGHDKQVHAAQEDTHYTVFSLWDTFRAAHPLYTITNQKRTADFINTFIRQYEQGGRLPVWELAGSETDTMIGYHAVSVIADAMAKGIEGFDYEKAYEAAKHSAGLDHYGLAAYKRRGYISMEDEQESVSKTLEYAYDDFCIAQMAGVLADGRYPGFVIGESEDSKRTRYLTEQQQYYDRSRYFENLFDPSTGFMRPRKNGGFVTPFQPNEVTFHFTEGNSWQYTFFVPHDIPRLIDLMGGYEKFSSKLDELFNTEAKLAGREQPDITGLIGQYAHGNEPSHHIAYLYNYAGAPWKTQKLVRRIMDEFYKPQPDGLIGNEDCGQMSAWYVLSASGFYPVTPGVPIYDLGTPLFEEIKYHLENGKTFTVKAPNVSPTNIYIKSAKINGDRPVQPFIRHDAIVNGGVLELEMSDSPVQTVFSANEYLRKGVDPFVAAPLIDGGNRVFKGQTTVSLSTTTKGAKIRYTRDGTEPNARSTAYKKPFIIDRTAVVKAKAFTNSEHRSMSAEARFFKKPNNWTVRIANRYNRQYTGGGDEGLIDGIRGTLNWASGEWQGYQPYDFEAVIDLQRVTTIKRVGGGFLQDARPWIWMPTHIGFEVSLDGVNFARVADIKTDVDPRDMTATIRDYKQDIKPVKARYVRVHAYNLGKIPLWHPGAGDDAFIFVDEIFID